ncbi:MAG TPA: hypothetical protein VIT42_10910 [Microlunatus sp.]
MHGPRRYSIRLDADCPATLRELIATRFDVVPEPASPPKLLIIDNLDQVALRALLLLLWDSGQSLRSVSQRGRGC